MPADNSHAERKITRRIAQWVALYDAHRLRYPERVSRECTVTIMVCETGADEIRAAEILADALARRASLKHKGD